MFAGIIHHACRWCQMQSRDHSVRRILECLMMVSPDKVLFQPGFGIRMDPTTRCGCSASLLLLLRAGFYGDRVCGDSRIT
jgi:hypothetical protein